MRENVRDRDRLEHILEAIVNILDFAEGKTKEELEADKLRYYGIVKNIEIIGEASYKLTHAFCNDVLVHDYYQISSKEVWKVI